MSRLIEIPYKILELIDKIGLWPDENYISNGISVLVAYAQMPIIKEHEYK